MAPYGNTLLKTKVKISQRLHLCSLLITLNFLLENKMADCRAKLLEDTLTQKKEKSHAKLIALKIK